MTAARLIMAATAGLAATLALAACNPGTDTTETHRYEVNDQVSRLVLDDSAGRVEIVVADGPIAVTETWHYDHDAPKTSHSTNAGTLSLDDGSCANHHRFRNGCSVDYSVRVPASTAVEVTAEAGSVEVTGLAGDLSVTADAGRVEGTGLSSQHTTVKADAGKVDLGYRTAPTNVHVQAMAGTISVTVPHGDSYAVDATSDAGHVQVDVPRDDSAPRSITAHSDAGVIKILNG
jgi:DUF4097 and DUF4098 domain-containing protein YvlB